MANGTGGEAPGSGWRGCTGCCGRTWMSGSGVAAGAEALELGRGGIKAVAEATGAHPDTVGRGVREAERRPARGRAPGGGRKKLADTDLRLVPALGRWWTRPPAGIRCRRCVHVPSTRNLAGALTKAGHPVSDRTVARLLRGRVTACRATPRWPRAPSTLTGTPSSATSPHGREFLAPGPGRLGGRQEEGEGRQLRQRRRRVAAQRPPERVNVHDFPSDGSAGRSPTASTTSARTPAG